MHIQFNEGNSGKVPVVHVKTQPPKTDYEDFITEFKRLLEQHGKPRRSKQVTNVPTDLVLHYLIRHGATTSFTSEHPIAGNVPHLPDSAIRNLNNNAIAATDSNLL